jgi:hypothetical protein
MKTLLKFLGMLALVLGIGIWSMGCEESTSPGGGGGGGGTTTGYGSGTATAVQTGTTDTLSISGTGAWPPTVGPAVVAVYDTVQNGLEIIAYKQHTGLKSSLANYDVIFLRFLTPGGVAVQTYTITSTTAQVFVGVNVDTARVETTAYVATSGSIQVTSVSGSTVQGTFSMSGVRASDNTTASFEGTFNITYVRRRSVVDDGGGGGGGGGGSGSIQFNSDRGNFSASGPYDSTRTSGQMVGAWRSQSSSSDVLEIVGYNIVSPTNINVSVVICQKMSGTLTTGSYAVTNGEGVFIYHPGFNPSDTSTADDFYLLSTGSVTLSTLSSTNAAGSFSGSGFFLPNPSQTINVTSGSFDVNYVSEGALPRPTREAIEAYVQRTVRKVLPQKN